jgi:hypothetical protein
VAVLYQVPQYFNEFNAYEAVNAYDAVAAYEAETEIEDVAEYDEDITYDIVTIVYEDVRANNAYDAVSAYEAKIGYWGGTARDCVINSLFGPGMIGRGKCILINI